jgi:hypothetical protein
MNQYYAHLHPIKKKTILTPDYTHFIDLSRSVQHLLGHASPQVAAGDIAAHLHADSGLRWASQAVADVVSAAMQAAAETPVVAE